MNSLIKKSRNTVYSNGFIARLHNRRIECFIRKDGNYTISFIKCNKGQCTIEDLQTFCRIISRSNRFITYISIRLSKEALCLLSEGFLYYINKSDEHHK